MDVIRAFAAQPRTPVAPMLTQAVITAKNADGLTVQLEGDSGTTEGVKWLSNVWPRVGSTVWIAKAGRSLIVIGAQDAGPDRVRAYRTTNQTLTNTGQWYVSNYDADVDEVGSAMHSTSSNTSRVVAQIDGEYLITAQASFAASATGSGRLQVRKNAAGSDTGGVAASPIALVSFLNANYNVINLTFRLSLVAGDYMESFVLQSAVASHQVVAGQVLSFLEMRGLTAA